MCSEPAEDEVLVAIVPRDGNLLTPAVLAEYCKGRMPGFAIPRFIEFLTTPPMTENGKAQKFRLRERGVTAATWDREAERARDRRSPAGRSRGQSVPGDRRVGHGC